MNNLCARCCAAFLRHTALLASCVWCSLAQPFGLAYAVFFFSLLKQKALEITKRLNSSIIQGFWFYLGNRPGKEAHFTLVNILYLNLMSLNKQQLCIKAEYFLLVWIFSPFQKPIM